jgi:hypothetical protein
MISRLNHIGLIAIIITSVIALSGCATALRSVNMPSFLNVSTSDQTAIIEGSKSGFNGYDCYVLEPSLTREIEVNAGNVTLLVRCHTFGNDGPSFKYAEFEFVAVANHRYRIVGYSMCMGCGKRSRLGYPYVAILDLAGDSQPVIVSKFSNKAPS